MAEIRKVSDGFQAEMKSAMESITDDGDDKPQSGSMASVTSTSTAATMEEADVTEVVARNDAAGPAAEGADGASAGVDVPDAETEPVRPAIDPADRAAG
jgi:hypothetical protein